MKRKDRHLFDPVFFVQEKALKQIGSSQREITDLLAFDKQKIFRLGKGKIEP